MKSQSPFSGMINTIALSRGDIAFSGLNASWRECNNTRGDKEMFFSLLFSIGDITNRHHNIFRSSKRPDGGLAQRDSFKIIYEWMFINVREQFYKFLFSYCFNEYISFDLILSARIETTGKTGKVIDRYTLLHSDEYLNKIAAFAAKIIKGNNSTHKEYLSKFLTRPRLSKRKGHKKLRPETRAQMKLKQLLLYKISIKCDFIVIKKYSHMEFVGYYNWRRKYIEHLESYQFSSKGILNFTQDQFSYWLDSMPSVALKRIRSRLLTKADAPKNKKWKQLPFWFLSWERKLSSRTDKIKVRDVPVVYVPHHILDEVYESTRYNIIRSQVI